MEQYKIDEMMTNLQSYLESAGIDTSKFFTCINPNHIDRHPSMKYFNDNKVYCFGCGVCYNLVDCICVMEHLDRKEAFKQAINRYCLNQYSVVPKQPIKPKQELQNDIYVKDYSKAFTIWHKNLKDNKLAQKYLQSRGIDLKLIDKFNLGYNYFNFEDFKFKGLIIPISKHCFSARNLERDDNLKYFKPRNSQSEIFNKQAIENEIPYCVITEGEFDCLSFETVGVNAVALSGANNTQVFIDMQKPLKTYILAFDNDNAGSIATNKLLAYFKNNEIPYSIFDNLGYKDANEALQADKTKFEEEIKEICKDIIDKAKRKQKLQNAEM